MVTYMESHTVLTYMSVKCTRRTLHMPSFTSATHVQPSLSNFTRRDSDFGERTCSRGTTRLEQNFPTSPPPPPQKDQTYTLFDIRTNANNINPTDKMNVVLTLIGLPQESQNVSCWSYTPTSNRTASRTSWKLFVPTICTQIYPNKINTIFIPTYLNC